MQHAPANNGHLDFAAYWHQSADVRLVGRLQHRLSARKNPQPLSLQNGQGTLRSIASQSEGCGWPYQIYESNGTRLGRVVHPGRLVFGFAMDLGNDQSSTHNSVAAHSRISETHGSNELSRGRQ